MSRLQANRNANQLIISIRYAINAGDNQRLQIAVDKVPDLEDQKLDEAVYDELYEIYDQALTILNIT